MKFPEKKIIIEGIKFNVNYINYCDLPDWYIVFDKRELRKFIKEMKGGIKE